MGQALRRQGKDCGRDAVPPVKRWSSKPPWTASFSRWNSSRTRRSPQPSSAPGCGIEPTGGTVYAPFDGKVTSIVSTLHAVGLESTEGIELLIHIGMDTIALRGSGFTPLVREGQAVKAGTALLKVDLDAIRAANHPTTTAVIVTNADDLPKLHIIAGGIVSTGTPLFKFE